MRQSYFLKRHKFIPNLIFIALIYNGAKCDLYVGKGAGKQLFSEIDHARSTIKIVSPYLSPYLVKRLIALHHKGLDVQLITSDKIEDYYTEEKQNIRKLIIQNRYTDEGQVIKRSRLKKWKIALLIASILTAILFVGLAIHFNDIEFMLGLFPSLILYLSSTICNSKFKTTQIYTYSYSQLFPFRVYLSSTDTYSKYAKIHSKIYIIDDRVAYMGSINFTYTAAKHNHETRIRTEDTGAIKAIIEEFNTLLNDDQIPRVNIQSWGANLYSEPIN